MRRTMCCGSGNFFLTLIIVLMLPLQAAAIPAITCHCFTDRSFDPARPAKADAYFLATTQNSFFAVMFKVDKKTIVMKKQQGANPDDLWIAYLIASKSGVPPEMLLQAKQNNGVWDDIIAPLRLSPHLLGSRFSQALKAPSTTAGLAEAVVDDLLLSSQLLRDGELAALRFAGASSQESIIAAIIAVRMKQPARQIYLEVKGGSTTWGALLQTAKINPKDLQREISAILQL